MHLKINFYFFINKNSKCVDNIAYILIVISNMPVLYKYLINSSKICILFIIRVLKHITELMF